MKTAKNSIAKLVSLLLVFIMLFALSSCKASSRDKNSGMTFPRAEMDGVATSDNKGAGTSSQRKIIKNAEFSLETKDYKKTLSDINAYVQTVGGYIESSSNNGNESKGNASANFVLKIPEKKYEEFKTKVNDFGNVLSSNESANDITNEYYDNDARLRVLKAQETRYLDLLKDAKSVEDILKIESELSRIRVEIERLETVMKNYDTLVNYASIYIRIKQTDNYSTNSFWDRIVNSLKDSMYYALESLEAIFFGIIFILPYLLVIGIVLLIVFKSIKRKNKKMNKNRNNFKDINQKVNITSNEHLDNNVNDNVNVNVNDIDNYNNDNK